MNKETSHIRHLRQRDQGYPPSLAQNLASNALPIIAAVGNVDLLQKKMLAVFSSMKCPGSIILKTYDVMKKLRDAGIKVIGGFHSPMERECLNILSKGKQPVLICPARSIEGMRVKPELRQLLDDGRLLILSPFAEKASRISSDRAWERNRFVAALAASVLIPHAAPDSKTEAFCTELIAGGTSRREEPQLAHVRRKGHRNVPVSPVAMKMSEDIAIHYL